MSCPEVFRAAPQLSVDATDAVKTGPACPAPLRYLEGAPR